MNDYLFSIIIPIYNVEKYIDRCIKSIQQQEKLYEIILVDDGSQDSSPQICDKLSSSFENICTIHKANGGLASARNVGMQKARGRYIFFIDPDDWIAPSTLSCLEDAIKKNNYPDIVKYNMCKVLEDGQIKKRYSSVKTKYYESFNIINELVPNIIAPAKFQGNKMFDFVISACTHIYKNDFLKRNNIIFVSERKIGSEDWLFNLEAFIKAKDAVCIDDILYFYDTREGSLTRKYRENFMEQKISLGNEIEKVLKSNGLYANNLERLYIFYFRGLFYDVIANEISYNDKYALKNIKNYFENEKIKESVAYLSRNSKDIKEFVILLLVRLHMYRIIILLKKKNK